MVRFSRSQVQVLWVLFGSSGYHLMVQIFGSYFLAWSHIPVMTICMTSLPYGFSIKHPVFQYPDSASIFTKMYFLQFIKESFGGNCQTFFIAAVSPAGSHHYVCLLVCLSVWFFFACLFVIAFFVCLLRRLILCSLLRFLVCLFIQCCSISMKENIFLHLH